MVANLIIKFASATVNCNQSGSCDTGLPKVDLTGTTITSVLQIVFGVIGALALITILIAAIQFVTSAGDSQGVNRARNTIIYALVGLVVAVLAETIVTFVLTNI